MNKKGIAPQTLIIIIIAVAGGILILFAVYQVFGVIFPTIGGFGCGVNVAIKGAMISGSAIGDVPLILCNQYNEPVKINAADFSACPGIATFCEGSEDKLRDQCYQQCARIQIDKLADTCWAIGGKGRYDLTNILDKAAKVVITDPLRFQAKIALFTASPIYNLVLQAFPETQGKSVDDLVNIAIPHDTKIIRCFKFQIVNPGVFSDRTPFNLSDESAGKSQLYHVKIAGVNKSLGGSGVAAVNPPQGTSPEMDFSDAFKMNYNVSLPRQICYIAYYQYFTAEGINFAQRAAIVRSCENWAAWTFHFSLLN